MSLISVKNDITIALSVRDRHASADWYSRMLGFETIYHADDAGWSEIQTNTPGVTIGFGEYSESVPGNCVPVFGIEDLEAARRTLEREDIKFDGETDVVEGMVKTATFYDPDGNALMLAEDLTQVSA